MALTTAQIQNAYVAFFNRPADVAGLNYWTSYNGSIADLFNAFAGSQEYKALFTGQNSTQVVNTVYQNLFGRSPDVAGLNYWVGQLDAGKVTVGNIANAVNAGAQGTDKTIIDNKVAAATSFTTALDTTSEIVGYAQASNATLSQVKTWLSAVTDQASTVTAATAALPALTTTVASGAAAASLSASLTTGQDNIVGTTGNDTFTARIFDNSNTLQSGDKIAGGGGTDTLSADIGNSQNFAITAETSDVETVSIRAQAVSKDSTDNNTASTSEVQIDAQRMVGVNQWESNNSRADLLIEDVRILDTQITKDITIAMVETDPGHVDYGVYFDQLSLRATNNASSTLTLEVMDTRSNAAGTGPLKDNPYNGFQFYVNGKLVKVASTAIDNALTYAELKTAITDAVKAVPELANFTVDFGRSFTVSDTLGSPQTGTTITLTSTKGEAVTTGTGSGWVAAGAVPPSSGLHTNMSTAASTSTEKVTSKVILDDVGRGSTGGDLVIGGLSVGDTSTSLGVERFEIEVRDNSKLQTINSTNNTLQEVVIKNGATTSSSFAYVTTEKDKGDLTVNGNVALTLGNSNVDNNVAPTAVSTTGTATSYGTGIDAALPGSATQHNAYGFSDVRLIDASGASSNSAGVATNAAFAGDLSFTAEVTARSIAKYMNLVDTQANPKETVNTGDGVNGFGTGSIANFNYLTGTGNDKIVVDVDGSVVSSRSLVVAGREDFTFNIDGGAGNDSITLKLINNDIVAGVRNNPGNGQNWYNNQDLNNNVTVSGGAGNDTIWTPGAGDVKIDGGAGNDTIYTDNTGFQAVTTSGATGYSGAATSYVKGQWVFNTVDQVTAFGAAPAAGLYGASGRNINDLRSDTNESYNFYNSKLVVTFQGIPTATAVTVTGTSYKTTDLEINQAIKKAINGDAVLSKLLVAEDGPANSLVVKSLIDGAMATTDLAVTLTPLTATEVAALSATEIAAAGAAYGLTAPTAATVSAAIAAAYTAFSVTNGDYVTAMANDGAASITGNNSLSTSDNLVLPGADNDVIVLGTTEGTSAAASSNETIVIGTSFGNDTVVNFDDSGFGQDYFDFTALKGTTLTAAYTTDKSITIQAATTLATSATVTEKAAVEALFNAANAAAQDHVFLSVNAHNVASVYTVVDAAGASNAVATLQGTIDLADVAWTSLTAANFTNSSATNYFLTNGPTGLNGTAGTGGTGTGTGTAGTVAVTAAGSVTETAATNTTFNVALGNYTYNIAGFGAGDKLVFPTAGLATVNNASFTDGIVEVQYASGGQTVVVQLTGIPAATDAGIFGVSSFNTAFGAGSLA
ncbi:hypothetical protein BXU06_15805 [Aquaspirillum sp. LM1]|uniref:DUF4214 domain-containing protein n=1 Tax=Aquaspirillum sp. LM1 TaxID=1938604 RepID=UPI000983C5D6|nr:DUF4214 domain-containing protein [Aquaspirillum sp. LM1]AQR66343.1 hypothetical protein BXU06_15805 [Aquaspirillum sp. LM1]